MDRNEILLSPIKIGTRTCVNRFFIQPMECTDADTEAILLTSLMRVMRTFSRVNLAWSAWKQSLSPIRTARA